MSIFDQDRPHHFKVIEIEHNLDRVKERVINFLVQHTPAYFWMPKFQKAIGWKSLEIKTAGRHLRGLAHYDGRIHLTLNDSSVWMDNSSDLSSLGGKEDVTPAGVLAHELGHQFMWAVQDQGASNLWTQYEKLKRATAVSNYGMTNAIEDFAEAYRLFAMNHKLLQRLSAERYSIITQMDEFLEDKTGFKHGLLNRQPGNAAFVKSRIEQLMA